MAARKDKEPEEGSLSRRKFVKGVAGTVGLGAASGALAAGVPVPETIESILAPPGSDPPGITPGMGEMGKRMSMEEMKKMSPEEMMGKMQKPIHDITFPRYEPGRQYSPPPPLMGVQMGKVHTLSVPPLGYEMVGGVKEFRLIAQPVWHEFTDGVGDRLMFPEMKKYMTPEVHMMKMDRPARRILGWGYNGNIPGPTLEFTEGDRVRIILTNELPEPTSIHWHGFEIPNHMDGAAPETQKPVMPGETFVYEFTVYQSGTLLYHSGFNIMKQDFLGAGGLVVIHPLNPPHKIDKEFAILHQEWVLKAGNPNPNIIEMDFNWVTFNGKVAPSVEPMMVRQGERVRIRQGNLSMDSHPIHMHGYRFNLVGTAAGPIPESAQWPLVTVNVPPGSTRDIEFVAWNPGIWRLHCHKLHHVMNGMTDMPMGLMPHGSMFTLLKVEPRDSDAPFKHPREEEVEAMKRRKRRARS